MNTLFTQTSSMRDPTPIQIERMPKFLSVLLLLCLAGILHAQDAEAIPQYELFVGGSYARVHASGAEASQVVGLPDYYLEQRNVNFNLYGWDTSIEENVNRWFGAEFDAAGLYGQPVPSFLCSASSVSNALSCLSSNPVRPSVLTKLHTFTFGPRFSFRNGGRIVPFVHVLAGVAHISGTIQHTSIFTPLPTLLPANTSRSNTALAVIPGAGLDLDISAHFAVRLIDIDYVMTRFYNQRQDNGRASFGVLWYWGHK